MEKLKRIECGHECGFIIQSHDEKEIIEIAKEHAEKMHNAKLTNEELQKMIKIIE